jgi:hypothetical protein
METLDDVMTPELFEEWLPGKRPLAGDTKEAAFPMAREVALKKKFIAQPKRAKKFMVLDFDIDQSDWWIKSLCYDMDENGRTKLPEPSWITINPETEHGQAGWAVNATVGSPKGLSYWDAVFDGMKRISGSDMGFVGAKFRNPTHPDQITEWKTSRTYSLKELEDYTEKPAYWYTKKNKLESLGRHNDLFNDLSAWSYREWRKPNFDNRIMLEAQRLNNLFDEPLPYSHLVTTARSIQGFISKHFSEAQFSAIQKNRANRRWQGQGAETNQFLLDHIDAGFTPKEIAELRGKSLKSTYNAISKAKKAAGRV